MKRLTLIEFVNLVLIAVFAVLLLVEPAAAAVRELPPPRFSMEKSDGTPASGWKVYTYQPGTTTAKNTYTTSAGDVANANPVILNARGEADIWWDGNYKVVIKDENDVTIYTVDNYGAGLDPTAATQLSLVKNYSFESATAVATTPDNWTITLYTNGTSTLDTAAGGQIHGAKGLKFTSTGQGGGYAESDYFEVQESNDVAIAWAMKSSVADVRNVVEIVWYDRSQSALSTTSLYDDSTTNPTSWTDKGVVSTPPSNARFAKLRFTGAHSSDSTTGSTWYDNARAINSSSAVLVSTSAEQVITNGGFQRVGTDLILWIPTNGRTLIKEQNTGSSGDRLMINEDGTFSSQKACASGYSRVGPNFCYTNDFIPKMGLSRDTCTTLTLPSGAKALLLELRLEANAANSVLSRSTTVTMHNDSGCATELARATAQGWEFSATSSGTTLVAIETHYILRAPDAPRLRFSDDAGNQGLASYAIIGYFD